MPIGPPLTQEELEQSLGAGLIVFGGKLPLNLKPKGEPQPAPSDGDTGKPVPSTKPGEK